MGKFINIHKRIYQKLYVQMIFVTQKIKLILLNLFMILIFLANGIHVFASDNTINTLSSSPEEKIANWIKPTLNDLTPEEIRYKMQEKFKRFKLMDDKGCWAHPILALNENELIPLLSKEDLYQFIDDSALIATQNNYLHNVLVELEKENLSDLYEKIQNEKYQFLPDAIIFAKALDTLTIAARNVDDILQVTFKIWEDRLQSVNMWGVAGIHFTVKFYSLRYPLANIIQYIQKHSIAENQFRTILPLNILEACAYGLYQGHYGNTYAGWQLAINPPGTKANPKTGAGPTRLSSDGKACQLYMPYGTLWNNLYCAWNVGYIAGFTKSISLSFMANF